MYTNGNWFVILMSHVYFGDLVTKICNFIPLKTNNSAQLRTITYEQKQMIHTSGLSARDRPPNLIIHLVIAK